jgi:MFS family permease
MECKDEAGKEIAENIAHGIATGIAIGIASAIAFVLFILLGGVIVQWLWNWLLPDIFGLRQITFWQALGLLALCRILFGSFGRGGGHHRDDGKHRREWWKKRPRQDGLATPPNPVSEGGHS